MKYLYVRRLIKHHYYYYLRITTTSLSESTIGCNNYNVNNNMLMLIIIWPAKQVLIGCVDNVADPNSVPSDSLVAANEPRSSHQTATTSSRRSRRTQFTAVQLSILVKVFVRTSYPDVRTREELANTMGVEHDKIQAS